MYRTRPYGSRTREVCRCGIYTGSDTILNSIRLERSSEFCMGGNTDLAALKEPILVTHRSTSAIRLPWSGWRKCSESGMILLMPAQLKDAGILSDEYIASEGIWWSALALKTYGTSIADDLASDKAYNIEDGCNLSERWRYDRYGILTESRWTSNTEMFEAEKAAFTVDGTWNCSSRRGSNTTLFVLRRSVLQEFLTISWNKQDCRDGSDTLHHYTSKSDKGNRQLLEIHQIPYRV